MSKALKSHQKGPCCSFTVPVSGQISSELQSTPRVQYLIDHGYDVWMENWRASIDFEKNLWTCDQAAAYDHPAAVETVCAATGPEQIKAVIHCQGSTTFMMSAVAGLIPQVTTIVTNGVSLHPIVPAWSAFKLNVAVPTLKMVTDYLNPQMRFKK